MTRAVVAGVLCAAAIVLSACSGGTDSASTAPDGGDTGVVPTMSAPPSSDDGVGTDSGIPTGVAQPEAGRGERAVRSVADYFAVQFSQFSPFVFDPAGEWFDSWKTYATQQLVGDMQVGLTDQWAWTWTQQVKAFDSQVVGTTAVNVDAANNTAVAVVRINRLILGINDTGDRARQQDRIYRLHLELRGTDDMALVSAVDESAAGT